MIWPQTERMHQEGDGFFMKLIFAIVNPEDGTPLAKALRENGIAATRLATTGGFLMRGNVTFMIGVEDNMVDPVISLISANSKERKELVPATAAYSSGNNMYQPTPVEVTVGGATVFVVDVDRFERL